MAATTINVQMQQRRDTAANWSSANPTLLNGEFGYETDTGKFKIGDGATAWNSLGYIPGFSISAYPLVNADIDAAAEIAVSKLANGTARQILQTDAAGTGVEFASNIDVPGTLDVTGNATFDADVTIEGDLTVNGTTTTIDTQTLLVEDKNIEMGVVTTPTDLTADGGGITLKGSTDKTFNWVDATDAWTSSEYLDLPAGSAANPSLFLNGDTNTGLYQPSADSIAFSTAGTGRLFIGSAGNVGIGTTTAGVKLDVSLLGATWSGAAATGNTALRVHNGDNSTTTPAYIQVSGGSAAPVGVYFGDEASSNRGALLYNHTDDSLRFNVSGSEAIRVTSSKNVGIGTSTPGVKLDVVQLSTGSNSEIRIRNVGAASTDIATLRFLTNGGATNNIWFGDGASSVIGRIQYNHTNDSLSLYTSNTEYFRIGSSGQIGLSGANYGTSGQVLTSNGSSSAPTWQDAGSGGKILQVLGASTTTTLSTTSATLVDATGLSVSLTPATTSSKVLVNATLSVSHSTGTGDIGAALLRDSTVIYETAFYDPRPGANIAMTILDSPATTSATTYKVQFKNIDGTTAYINENNEHSAITVQEVGA